MEIEFRRCYHCGCFIDIEETNCASCGRDSLGKDITSITQLALLIKKGQVSSGQVWSKHQSAIEAALGLALAKAPP